MNAEKIDEIKHLVKVYSGLLIKESLELKFDETYKTWVARTGNNPYKLADLLKNNTEMLREFISDLTINESYFFRNAEQFKCIDQIVSTPINKKPEIKILSIGCSNGCEPYSIAIYIHKYLPEIFKKISIIGIDISQKVIDIAKSGVYQSWYLRHTRKEFQEEYFEMTEDNQFAVVDKIKNKVQFETANFLDYEAAEKYQIIFCRNFLIYFEPDTVNKICDKIANLIDKNGIVIFGNSDALLVNQSDLIKKGCYYTIDVATEENIKNINDISVRVSYDINSKTNRPKKDESEVFKKGVQFIKSEDYVEAAKEFEFILTNINPKNIRAATFLGYSYYKLNNLSQAKAVLKKVLDTESLSYESYLLYAIILYEEKNCAEALEYLRKALFINPQSEISWFYLGKIYECQKETSSAINAYKKALSFLELLPENKKYPLSPEISSGMLKEWITNKISEIEKGSH
jgi:chemotaxis protein methyltransferase CheR